MIQTIVRYVASTGERPFFYQYDPPPGTQLRNTVGNKQRVEIGDARTLDPAPTLDREGFALVHHETRVENLFDESAVRAIYFPEMEALVASATGARRVVAFDHNVRSALKAEQKEDNAKLPVRFPHNDYTAGSGPQRVRDLLPADADELLKRRFAVINVWKPIRGPVEEAPLAICDARSIGPDDLLASDLRYLDRTGEIYSLAFNAAHRWYYYPAMQPSEAMLLKCYDSDSSHARFTAHTAVDDPTGPPNPRPRESIEVRTLAFY